MSVTAIPWPEAERIVGTVVRRHYRQPWPAVAHEDMVQDAMERLWRASPYQDGAHLAKAIVGTIAHRQLIDTLRRYRFVADRDRPAVPLPRSIDVAGFIDQTMAPECDRAELMDMVSQLVRLSERERFVLVSIAHGWIEREVASVLRVSTSRVHQIKRAAWTTLAGDTTRVPSKRNVVRLTERERQDYRQARAQLRQEAVS